MYTHHKIIRYSEKLFFPTLTYKCVSAVRKAKAALSFAFLGECNFVTPSNENSGFEVKRFIKGKICVRSKAYVEEN